MEAELPKEEAARLEALRRYRILDTPQESDFDEVVRLVAQICETPMALVSLVDRDRQWFKGRYGLELSETPRRLSFCAHSILQAPALTEVPDATQDRRFADNELVTGELGIRFYAAVPLVSREAQALGTLCVLDTKPRRLTEPQKEALRVLGRQVMMQLELRRHVAELERTATTVAAAHVEEATEQQIRLWRQNMDLARAQEECRRQSERFGALAQATFEGILFHKLGRIVDCNEQFAMILGCTRQEVVDRNVTEFLPPQEHELALRSAREHQESTLDLHVRRKDGTVRVVEVHGRELGEADLRVATVRDVTDRKKVEEELRRSEAKLGGIVTSAMDGVISMDEQQRIVLFNPAAEKLFGVKAEEVMGESIERLIPERYRAAHARHVEEFGRTGVTNRRLGGLETIWALRANGEEFPIEASVSQVALEGGKLYTVILRDITERRQAEQRLKESEEQMRLYLASAPASIAVLDRQMRYLAVSRRWMQDYGLSGNVIGRSHYELFPEVPERWKAVHRRALAGETLKAEADRFERADGRVQWVKWEVLPWHTAAGEIGGIMIVSEEITARKQAEEQARRWERVFETADFGLALANARDNTLLAVNASFARQRGYTPEELKGKSLLMMYAPEVRDTIKKHLVEIDATGHLVYESVHQRKDGSRFPVLMEVTVIRDAHGQPESRVTYSLDITEPKATEAALRQSEERFRTLADAMPQLAWIARPDGHIVWYNRRWYEYTGTHPEQMEGWGWQQVPDPAVLPVALEQWRRSLASGEPFNMELPLRGVDGAFHPFLTRVVPLKDERGQVRWWFGTSTDIREIVAARETLARSREELERLVQERTAQLAEANANLQNFAHTAAHDLRSPLRGIASFAQLLVVQYRERLDPMGRSMLERVVESAAQMSRLLNDLLEYSKITQGDLRLERVKLEAAIREALALLESDIRARQAEVSVATPLPEVVGHSATVVMVVANLVSNGLKFMPEGVKPQLRIWAERRDVERGSGRAGGREASQPGHVPRSTLHVPTVRLWVEDNGIGIAPEDQQRVFGAFQRLHAKGTYPGTGLGLAIVRKGVERMGGRVGLESELGKGSRFWVELRSAD
jgi:PAS domain S-box-containing protein